MFDNFLKWRQENDIDNIIENFQFTENDAVVKAFPTGMHKVCKLGRPIYIERPGCVNAETVFELTTHDRLI
jgi:hypothetical protein